MIFEISTFTIWVNVFNFHKKGTSMKSLGNFAPANTIVSEYDLIRELSRYHIIDVSNTYTRILLTTRV